MGVFASLHLAPTIHLSPQVQLTSDNDNRPRSQGSEAGGGGGFSASRLLKQQWQQKYKDGSQRERKLIKIGGCFSCLILLVIIAITIAALIFTTLCGKLNRELIETSVDLGTRDFIKFKNGYENGE